MIEKGARVAEHGSWYVGTVISDWPNNPLVLVEYDAHGRYAEGKRTELKFMNGGYGSVRRATGYNEFHNACQMRDEGAPTVLPPNPYDPVTGRLRDPA